MQAVFVRERVAKRVENSQIMKVVQNATRRTFQSGFLQNIFMQSDDF